MTLYCADICFNWCSNSERNVESLIINLSSSSLASFRPPSLGSLTRILSSYLMNTWSNNFGTSWGCVLSSNITLRRSLEIGDWKTWGWRVIHAYILRFICSFIFECPFRFIFLVHRLVPTFMDLSLDFQPQYDVLLF